MLHLIGWKATMRTAVKDNRLEVGFGDLGISEMVNHQKEAAR
jgi:hypothetical protein